MNRRQFLQTITAGSVMIMLPSLAESVLSGSGINTVEDFTAWMESRYECHMGETRAYMSLTEEELKKYNLGLDDLPVERKVWATDNYKQVNLIYTTVAFAVEGSDSKEAERQLVQALKEKLEEIPPQTLIWRVKPEFTSDQMTEYRETFATHEQVEDGLFDRPFPADVEYDFNTGSYKHVKRKYVLNKLRMRLVFPKQIAEDYEELTIADGGHPKRI
jgi:hypothetical protein